MRLRIKGFRARIKGRCVITRLEEEIGFDEKRTILRQYIPDDQTKECEMCAAHSLTGRDGKVFIGL
jgi:hypothetical protein